MRRTNSERLLPFAKDMRREPSQAEKKLWFFLRNRGLEGLKFRRQVPVGPFVADFACDDVKLIIEVDGDQHDMAQDYDAARDAKLNALGWRVLRLYSKDVLSNPISACGVIAAEAKSPDPNPLP